MLNLQKEFSDSKSKYNEIVLRELDRLRTNEDVEVQVYPEQKHATVTADLVICSPHRSSSSGSSSSSTVLKSISFNATSGLPISTISPKRIHLASRMRFRPQTSCSSNTFSDFSNSEY